MKNATELRDRLSKVFVDLEAGSCEIKTASELANIAGKMISSAKAQVEYYALRKESPNITFLQDDRK